MLETKTFMLQSHRLKPYISTARSIVNKAYWYYFEFTALYFGIPLIIYMDTSFIHPTALLLPLLAFVLYMLYRQGDFSLKELIRWDIDKTTMRIHLRIVGVIFVLLLVFTWGFYSDNLFNLPKQNPLIFIMLSFFYPLFSAWGQEILYRTFLYRRYKNIFTSQKAFILASAVSFSFLHIVYYHWLSMLLTFIAGAYLAYVYTLTKSVLFSAFLHSLLGLIVFGVGLGEYFWLSMPQERIPIFMR